MAINPTVSRVTPVANGGNRPGAPPAGYGRRWPASGFGSELGYNAHMEVDLKEEAKRLIDAMPRLSSWDDLMHEIFVRQTIEAGIAQSEQDLGRPVEEIRARYTLPE